MTGEELAQAVAAELGLEPLTEQEIGTLLKIASVAAHSSERLAAPLCTYLAGRAGIEEVRAAVERVSDGSEGRSPPAATNRPPSVGGDEGARDRG